MIHQAKSNPQLLDEQIFSERLASAISAIVQVFGCRHTETILTLGEPASEKRQGRKIAGCGAPTVQRALWGFDAGVSVGEVEPTLAIGSL